ncbi:uncharacterized protein LOC117587969 [Drosophila guanche]|uniref:uncharacterized protein LOC117587969 n=1 Tax=Drosophila guanche TaxID=7266 RepID=UPI001471C406|nr:uncharacterized protein LOC117587969 [Drosophila guanche]
MIRLYKLYSLFLKTMENASTDNLASVQEWCSCEKLPRAALHMPLNWNLLCEVCGLERRAKTDPSSSDEEEAADNELQKMLLERRRVEEALHGAVRVKVAKRVKKPCSMHNCKNCFKCGGVPKPRAKECKTKDNSDCLEDLPKPIEVLPEWRRGVQIPERDPTPTATPSTLPSSEKSAQHAFESLWEPLPEASQSVRGKHLVSRRLSAPIDDPSGGAISKQGRLLHTRPRRPLPPLSKISASTLAEKEASNALAKGGGLSHHLTEYGNPVPFEYYEGPSEDALVVDSALSMLQEPMALNMKPVQRLPLPCPSSTGSDESVISGSPKPLDMVKPPVARRSSPHMQTDITKVTPSDSCNSGAIKTPDIPRKKYSFLEIKIIQMMKGLRMRSPGHDEVEAAENEQLESYDFSRALTPPSHEVLNEHVISSNKYQTDEQYSKDLSMKTLHVPGLSVRGRLTGRQRAGVKPMSKTRSPLREYKVGSVCDKCGHQRKAGVAGMPHKDTKGKSVKAISRKYSNQLSRKIRMEAEEHTKTCKQVSRISENVVDKQTPVSKSDNLHGCSSTNLAKQQLAGFKLSCKEIKDLKNHLTTPMKPHGDASKKYHSLSGYEEPLSSSQTAPDSDNSFCESLPAEYLPKEYWTEVTFREIHTLGTVSHVCGEKPKMAAHRSNVMGNLQKSTLSDQAATNMAIFEFRMPDIDANAVNKCGMASSPRIINKPVSSSRSPTPVAHSPTPRRMGPGDVPSQLANIQRRNWEGEYEENIRWSAASICS